MGKSVKAVAEKRAISETVLAQNASTQHFHSTPRIKDGELFYFQCTKSLLAVAARKAGGLYR